MNSCFYYICSLLMEVPKCFHFLVIIISFLLFSSLHFYLQYKNTQNTVAIFYCPVPHLFQVFHYVCELGSYWILFVFMFRMLLPHFMAVGLLGWEDVLLYISLSLPSLFCIHLLGHPKCFLFSLKIYLTHNRCGARWGEKA